MSGDPNLECFLAHSRHSSLLPPKRKLQLLNLLWVLLLFVLVVSCGNKPGTQETAEGVVVLGLDGMDPQLLQRYMDEGERGVAPDRRALTPTERFRFLL